MFVRIRDIKWRIIRFLRGFYFYHGGAPMNRDIKKEIGLNFMEMEVVYSG